MSTDDIDPSGSNSTVPETHKNAAQDVVAVDADDEPTGTVNRLEAHTGDGIRH
ncbi:MAG: isopentenyl-diphosphate delta-isomerase, partial [Phycisphaeraceae bacterium]